jgi:hypothetical protein
LHLQQALVVPSDVPLTGSCIAPGSNSGQLFVVAANGNNGGGGGGVWALLCDAAASCTASLVADADSSLLQVTACAAASFGGGEQAFVAAASPQGLFATAVVLAAGGGPAPQELLRLVGSGAGLRGGGVPDGDAVAAVAVAAGWSGGAFGLALACVTRDHVYYASSPGRPAAALALRNDGAGDGGDGLVWRKEWVTLPDEAGGTVDWAVPRFGLAFEPTADVPGALGPPRLWVGGGKGLQVVDLGLGTWRRLDGFSAGLPYENVTAVAFGSGSPKAWDSSQQPLATSHELWLGTALGAARRTASTQPGAAAGSTEWRYLYGARWLPGADGYVRQLVPARYGSSSSSSSSSSSNNNNSRRGGRSDGQCSGCARECSRPGAGAVAVTVEGLAVWLPECATLSGKATAFEQNVPTPKHTRYGLVADCSFTSGGGGDSSASCETSASDNDGLWTALYAASQVFKAATLAREGAAYGSAFNASVAEAKEKFAALKKLFDVTGRPGCPARSFAK